MRVGCGSAAIGMFAKQWYGKVDEVVVVDDHITGVLSEHQAGKLLGAADTGIKMKGRRSTPGRYFHVADRELLGAAANISDPLDIITQFRSESGLARIDDVDGLARPGQPADYRVPPGSFFKSGRSSRCPRICRCLWSAFARIASRRCVRYCLWAEPAARCARRHGKSGTA